MTPLPIGEWTAALDQMDAALAAAAAELDRYEQAHAPALAPPAPPGGGPAADGPAAADRLAGLDGRFAAWDAKLAAAADLAAAVERDLDRREETVTRWRGVFDRWREVIQHR